MITEEIRRVLAEDVLSRFLRYVQVWTTSDPTSQSCPSSERQLDLIRILERECREFGLDNVVVDDRGFLYATLPAREGVAGESFGLLAHVDTSPDQSGEGVRPQLHKNWQGGPIRFPDDNDLVLDPNDSEELRHFIGDTIVTASGTTLLGADD